MRFCFIQNISTTVDDWQGFDADPDPDPTFYFDADLDRHPTLILGQVNN